MPARTGRTRLVRTDFLVMTPLSGLLFWLRIYVLNKLKPPDKAPTLNEVVRLVARLGGFLARKNDGEPGVKTIWLGMQRVIDFASGIRYVKELQAQGICV
jgi:Transposase Tn5 dimerisation domain